MREALETWLQNLLGPGQLLGLKRLAGGASKESWALDYEAQGQVHPLFLRREAGGVMTAATLPLEWEHRVLALAHAHGVPTPRPLGFHPDLEGRPAILMERLPGESIGARVVRRPDLEAARAHLPLEMAEALARIHGIPLEEASFLPGPGGEEAWRWAVFGLYRDLDRLGEPHPAVELGLRWLLDHPPPPRPLVVVHGDFRIGNLLVEPEGLVAVLDWEFAHLGDPREDLAWPLVRAWRFGRDKGRLGGISPVGPFLERYNALTGLGIAEEELLPFELLGNLRWAVAALGQARRHLEGETEDMELAVLGRLAAEVEYEILHLLEVLDAG